MLGDDILTTGGADDGRIKEVAGGDAGKVKFADKEVALADVVRLDFGNKKARVKAGFLVVMTNGDRIVGNFTGGDENGVIVDTKSLGRRKVSIDNLLAFFNLAKVQEGSFVEEKIALDNAADIAFLTGDQETEGTIRKLTGEEVVIKVEDLGDISLGYGKLRAVKLAPLITPKAIEGLRATVYLTDGSRVSGKLTSYKDGKLSMKWFGIDVELVRSSVRTVYFSGGKFVHLSDLKPVSVNEVPFFDNFLYHYQLDYSLVRKQTISIRRKKFFKGVSVHSKTELVYNLDGQYAKFVSTIGIDDEARGKGDVVFIVYGDGKELFRSKNITGKAAPQLIKLSVEGVKELKLVVDFGKNLDTMDRAAWADAVLVKK